jgi:hypothetical protein
VGVQEIVQAMGQTQKWGSLHQEENDLRGVTESSYGGSPVGFNSLSRARIPTPPSFHSNRSLTGHEGHALRQAHVLSRLRPPTYDTRLASLRPFLTALAPLRNLNLQTSRVIGTSPQKALVRAHELKPRGEELRHSSERSDSTAVCQ